MMRMNRPEPMKTGNLGEGRMMEKEGVGQTMKRPPSLESRDSGYGPGSLKGTGQSRK